jgi:deazaflavin-dependent oxidoreductase (nitroreductase family)
MTTRYNRPSGIVKRMNAFLGWLSSRGIGPKRQYQLQHKGRKSGKIHSTAVSVTEVDGQRYLVAPRGETQWIRNIRADNLQAVLKRGAAESIRLEEVPSAERAAIIKNYVGENSIVKGEFGVEPDDPIEKYEAIVNNHPTFRIHPA